jgi:uncharacterized protein YkwD
MRRVLLTSGQLLHWPEESLLHLSISIARRRSPRRTIARGVGLAATSLLAAGLLVANPAPATGWNQGAAEATLWQLMNGARVNNGLRAVQSHSTLVSLARWRSKDMLDRNYFNHVILGTNYQVYHWYDTNGLNYTWGGENIGWNNGYSDADSPVKIHEGFMASPSHRANMLTPGFTHGGVGAYARDNINFLGKIRSPRMYTELFMQAASASAPPPPPPSGGGGGGSSGGGGSYGGGVAAPTPKPTPATKAYRVDTPTAPRPSKPLDGPTLVASVGDSPVAAVRAMTSVEKQGTAPAPAVVQVASHVRIEAPAAPERGLFETVLGSLLGFVL